MEKQNIAMDFSGNSLLNEGQSILLDVPFYKVREKVWISKRMDNRNIRRAVQQEDDKVRPILQALDDDFVMALFDDKNKEESYEDMYKNYLDNYHFTQDRIKGLFKIRVIELYDDHFADMYAPLEKEPYHTVINTGEDEQ